MMESNFDLCSDASVLTQGPLLHGPVGPQRVLGIELRRVKVGFFFDNAFFFFFLHVNYVRSCTLHLEII